MKTGPKIAIAFLLILLVLSIDSQFVAGQTPSQVSDDEVNAIAQDMYCPVCENVPLDVCPTTACAQWRELIREKLAEGWSETRIKDYFAQQYGWNVLAVPPRTGLNWLVYVLPPMIFAGGILIVILATRKAQKTAGSPSTEKPDVKFENELLKRVEADLKKKAENERG